MTLVFHDEPLADEISGIGIVVRLQGTDKDKDIYVEYRVTQNALRIRCGARSLTGPALERAFKQHRSRIEEVAWRKYKEGNFKPEENTVVVLIEAPDLQP